MLYVWRAPLGSDAVKVLIVSYLAHADNELLKYE